MCLFALVAMRCKITFNVILRQPLVFQAGLPDLFWYKIPKRGKYIKTPDNITTDQKYTKWL
jgi:hypothetical protein